MAFIFLLSTSPIKITTGQTAGSKGHSLPVTRGSQARAALARGRATRLLLKSLAAFVCHVSTAVQSAARKFGIPSAAQPRLG